MTDDEYQDKLISTLVFTVVEILQGLYVDHERCKVSKDSYKSDIDKKTIAQEKLLERMTDLIVYKSLAKTGELPICIEDLKNAVRVDLIRKTKELMEGE